MINVEKLTNRGIKQTIGNVTILYWAGKPVAFDAPGLDKVFTHNLSGSLSKVGENSFIRLAGFYGNHHATTGGVPFNTLLELVLFQAFEPKEVASLINKERFEEYKMSYELAERGKLSFQQVILDK
jgi:hypothetical protein